MMLMWYLLDFLPVYYYNSLLQKYRNHIYFPSTWRWLGGGTLPLHRYLPYMRETHRAGRLLTCRALVMSLMADKTSICNFIYHT